MSFSTHLTEHARLAILRLLSSAGGDYSANDSILVDALPRLGFTMGRDELRAKLAWLRDSQLIRIEEFDGLMVARLTQRGLDVSAGKTEVPGVKKPSPKN